MKPKFIYLFLIPIVLGSCNGIKAIKSALNPPSPYERYVESLEKADLASSVMVRAWLEAGESAFQDSIIVDLPFSESGYFDASHPDARGYRFQVRDGQVLTAKAGVKAQRNGKLFMDLFILKDGDWRRVAFSDSTLAIIHEFGRDEQCLLRLQPELLVNAYYALNISVTPALINPVLGATNKSIGSFYGASRDNGRRSHEGVDIFAPKGTPVVAPISGVVTRVGLNNLGGKVVWMRDLKRGHSYYFAHLDSQMVNTGQRLDQGDLLGTVGNTGNARTTPPHLHFGIYQRGSKDPLFYIQQIENVMATLPIDTGFHRKPFKVGKRTTHLMTGPASNQIKRQKIERDTYVTVVAQSDKFFRVVLPDHAEGYIFKDHLQSIDGGEPAKLDSAMELLSGINDAIPLAYLEPSTPVTIHAKFKGYDFVTLQDGTSGWVFSRHQ